MSKKCQILHSEALDYYQSKRLEVVERMIFNYEIESYHFLCTNMESIITDDFGDHCYILNSAGFLITLFPELKTLVPEHGGNYTKAFWWSFDRYHNRLKVLKKLRNIINIKNY